MPRPPKYGTLLARLVEFSSYIQYCRTLGYSQKPDYAFLRSLFHQVFLQQCYDWDFVFDWCLPIESNKNAAFHNGKFSIQVNLLEVKQYKRELPGGEAEANTELRARNKLMTTVRGGKEESLSNAISPGNFRIKLNRVQDSQSEKQSDKQSIQFVRDVKEG